MDWTLLHGTMEIIGENKKVSDKKIYGRKTLIPSLNFYLLILERDSISFDTILAIATDSCLEYGHHLYGDVSIVESIDDVADARTCQSRCVLNSRCNWFNWNYPSNPKTCKLLTKKGNKKLVDGRGKSVTGPKRCGRKKISS